MPDEKRSTITPGHLLTQGMRDIASAMAAPGQAPPSSPEDRGWRELDEELSNFDRTIPDGLAERLRASEVYCGYAAWNFYAHVWWENDAFHADVRQHRQHKATITAATLPDLMEEASEAFGYD